MLRHHVAHLSISALMLACDSSDTSGSKALGETCTGESECASGNCRDDVCCDTECSDYCQDCSLPDTIGTCSPVTDAPDPDTCPVAPDYGLSCDSTGSCLRINGEGCNDGSDCISGYCADSMCCDSPCDEPCQGCGMTPGTCTTLTNAPDPPLCVACDSTGRCLLELGEPCADGSECMNGYCYDGVCCNTMCEHPCATCDAIGNVGTCSAITNAEDPDFCTGPNMCNAVGDCVSDCEALGAVPGNVFSDSFDGETLDICWTVISPNPDSTVGLTGSGELSITASPLNGGSDYHVDTNYAGPRVLHDMTDDGFEIETMLTYSPSNDFEAAGIMICYTDSPPLERCKRVAERAFFPGAGGSVVRSVGSYVGYTNGSVWLRVRKVTTELTGWYSTDGITWVESGTGIAGRTVVSVGVFALRQPWDSAFEVYSVANFSELTARAP